jgi:hypothetical protein
MKRISLLAVLISGVLASGLLAAKGSDPYGLDGREIVVRVYRDWRTEPYHMRTASLPLERDEDDYETIALPINDRSVQLDFDEPCDRTMVLITPQDQTDPMVRQAWGNVVYAHQARPDWSYSLGAPASYRNTSFRWTFLDAFGDAIPNARVRVFLPDDRNPTKAEIIDSPLDPNGCMVIPAIGRYCCAVVSHADYGTAFLKNVWFNENGTCVLPLAKSSSETDAQFIRGVVLDDANNPISGASVTSRHVHTPGEGIIFWPGKHNEVLTGQNGRFSLCLPVLLLDNGPETIPPNSEYPLCVLLPKALLTPPHWCEVPTGILSEVKIHRLRTYVRRFIFQDRNGRITDLNRLDRLRLFISTSEKTGLHFTYDELKDGGRFPLGEYEALINDPNGLRGFRFEPIEVTAKTPELLVFAPETQSRRTFVGKAVHGLTNTPAHGAFIVVGRYANAKDTTEAMISDHHWQLLHQLGTEPSLDEPALESLHSTWNIRQVVRADHDGHFQIELARTESAGLHSCFFVVEQGCVPVYHNTYFFKDDPNLQVQLPPSRLFPAAMVRFSVPCPKQNPPEFQLSWDITTQDSPLWVEQFSRYNLTKGVAFPLHRWMRCDRSYIVSIPAGLSVNLLLRGDSKHMPFRTEPLKAEPGELIDLGQIDVDATTIPIHVQLVDSEGKGVGGVAVRNCQKSEITTYKRDCFGQAQITDREGFAEFHVPPHCKAHFAVDCRTGADNHLLECTGYETNGPQDANNIYTLQLSDEMLYHLFK